MDRTGMAVDPLIELHDVTTYFGEPHVPQDVDLTVGTGEATAVTGPPAPPKGGQPAR
ncbi:hypothetical protein ACFWA4_34160 [Streptomyces sp. NPDC060011]|uniref:hypothetical protein n=1 Tax=unclassified Streptomyces TaxID=2593676 RepID=UPI0036346AD2